MNILHKNLLILASAGSGKTFQLGNRVIGLVARGVEPERIVALTFTRKAAGEFADSVLTKLANAADSPPLSSELRETLALPDADFSEALERVVRALPRFTLGTMDSFFSKVVRAFQYELGLTGGAFELIQGPRAAALTDELLAGILGDVLASERGDQFFQAFRRATVGREDRGVLNTLREFVTRWHDRFRETSDLDWGPSCLSKVTPDEWTKQKSSLAAMALRDLDHIEFTDKRQRAALEKEIGNLEQHTIGSGSLASPSTLMKSLLQAAATQHGALTVRLYKEFTIGGLAGQSLRDMIELAGQCEFAAALARTRAIRGVVEVYDNLCAQKLRKKGMLSFSDVKTLMGEWTLTEEARLRREAVDFRLDARFDHWLLDEFQDTSRADWSGLQPLIDEAASDPEGSVFVVGDRKQAIYAWRGGDHTLFDEIMDRYRGGIEVESMAESWRSCPEVLSLVNHVCGDSQTMRELFGEAAAKWTWENHFPAKPLESAQKRGHARVEMLADSEARMRRLCELLREAGVGERSMSCGILLRNNQQVKSVAELLRAEGFDVIEDGRREPAKDTPVGIAVTHLLKWLASPSDDFARKVVEISPLRKALESNYGPSWWNIWERLTDEASISGFTKIVATLLNQCWEDLSDYGQRRAGDIIAALAEFDAQCDSPNTVVDCLERLEIPQSPGDAAIQVMTIHKSKGLGFDVVILPEIPTDGVPQSQYFDVAETNSWLSQTPPKWARDLVPELKNAEATWADSQRYEAFCMLYVALTRAKRGLYVLMETPSQSADPQKPSLSNWLLRSIDSPKEGEVIHETGSPDWSLLLPQLEFPIHTTFAPTLEQASFRRKSIVASKSESYTHVFSLHTDGKKLGAEIHAILEQLSWLDEISPVIPDSDAGAIVSKLLQNPELDPVFHRSGRHIEVFREQAAESILNDHFLTGIIDRMHLHRDHHGVVTKVEIYDFKLDTGNDTNKLISRYRPQMDAYKCALERIFPAAEVECALISVIQGAVLRL